MTDTKKYYRLKLHKEDAHYFGNTPERRRMLKSAKWYKHPQFEDQWCSEPEISKGLNDNGFYFSRLTTLTPIDND